MIDFSSAFDRTLVKFGITGRQLSASSGVSEGVISKYRHGKVDILSASLAAMVAAMPFEAKQYFFSQVLGSSISFNSLIKDMSPNQKSEVLMAIASTMSSSNGSDLALSVAGRKSL